MSLLSNKFKDINNITYAHKNGLLIKPVLTAGCERGVTPGPHMLHYRCLDVFSSSGALKNMFIKSNNYPSKKMISWIYLCRVYYLFIQHILILSHFLLVSRPMFQILISTNKFPSFSLMTFEMFKKLTLIGSVASLI